MAAHERLGAVTLAEGALEPKVRQFVFIALYAATTHLWAPGARRSGRRGGLSEGRWRVQARCRGRPETRGTCLATLAG